MSSSSVETRPLLLRSRTLLFAAAIAATLFQAIVQPAHASSSTTVTTVNQPLTLQAEVKLQFYLQDQQFGVHDSQLDSWVPSDDYYFGITLRNYFLSAMEAGLKTVLGNAQDAGVQPYGGSTAVPVVEITDIHRVLNVPSTSRLLLTSGRGTEKRQNNYASAAAVATTSKRGRAGRKNKRLLDHRSSRNRDRKPWWWWMENGDEDEDGSSTWDEDERDRDEEENEDDTNQRSDEQQGTIPESRNNDDNSNSWNNNGNAEGSSVDDQEFDPNWWHDNENRNVAPTTQAPPRPAPQPAAAPPMLSPAPAPGTNTAAPGSTSSGTPNVVATQDEPVVVSSTATPGVSAADLSVSDVVLRIHYLADPSTSYTAQNQYQVEELRKHLKLIFTTDSARIWLKDEMEYSLRTMAVESAVLRKSNLVFSPGMKVLSVSMPGVENGEWHDLASSPTLTVAGNNAAPGGNTNNNNNAEVLRHRPGTTSTGSTTGGASQPSEPAYDFNPDLYPQAGIIGSASGMNNGGGRSSPTSAEMEEPGEEEPLDEQLDLLWVVIFIATGWIFIFGFWTVCCSGSGPCGDSLQSSFYKDAMNNKITPDSNDIIVGIPTDGNPNIAHGQPVANTSRGPDATVGQPVMAGRAAGQQPVVIDTGAPAAVAARAPTQNLHPPGGSTTTTGTGTAGHNQQVNHQQPMLNKLNPCSACLESTIGVFTFVFESVKGFCNTVMVLFCCIPFHAGLRCLAGVKSSFVSCFGMVVANMFSGWKNGGRNNNKRGSTSGGNHSPQASKVDQNLIPKLYKPYFRQLREQISRHLEAEKRNFTLQSRLLEQAAASGPTSASAVESTTTSPSEGSGTGTTTTTATTAGGETKINAGGAEQTNSTAPKQLHFIIPTDKFLEQVQNKVNPLEKRKIFEQCIKMTSRDKKFDDKELQDLNNALESWMDSSEYRELKKLEKAVNTFYTDEVKVTKQQFQEAAAGTTTKQDEPDEVNLSSSSSSLSSPHDTKIAGDKNFETNQQKIVLRNESLLKKLLQEKKEDLQRLLTMTLNSFVQKYENCVTLKDQKSIRLVLDRIDAGLAVLKAAENLMGEPLNACLISGNNGSCKKLELNHFLHPGKKKLLKMKKKKEAGVVSPDSAADHVGVDIDDTPDRRGGQHQVHGGPQQTGQHKPTPAPYLNQQHLYKKLQSLEQDILHTDPAEKDTEPALEVKILAQFLQDLSSTNAHETILNNPNQLELYRALEQCAQTGGGVLTSTCDSLKPFHLCSLHNGFINNNNEVGTKNYGKKPVEQQEETTAKNAGKRTSTTSLVHHLTFPAILDHIFETNLILLKRATVLKKLQNLLQSDRFGAHLAENTKLFQELKFLRLDTWNNEAFNEAKQRIDKYKSSVWFGQNLTQMLDGTFFGDNNGARAGAAGTAAAPNRGGTATAGSVMVNNFTSDNAGPSSTDATTAGANNNNRTFTLSSLWKPKVQSLSLHRLIQDLIDDTFIKDVKTRDRKDSVHGNKVPKRLLVQKITKIQNSKHFSLYQERKREILEDCKKLEKLNGQQNVHAVKKYCVKSKEDNIKTFSAIPSWTQKCPNLFKQEPIEPQNVNEFYLFHGTTPEAAELITDTEFHLKKAGTNAGSLYGKGLYFAESSTKADEYTTETRDEELRPLILCRVVLGHVRYCEKQKLEKAEVEALVRQCTKSENTDQVLDPAAPSSLYHSVLGDREKCRNTFREFVVYDQAQTYPEYIVWYKRKY